MASAGSSKREFHVGGQYRLVRKVGSGSFGDIYLGIDVLSGEVSINGADLLSLLSAEILYQIFKVHCENQIV